MRYDSRGRSPAIRFAPSQKMRLDVIPNFFNGVNPAVVVIPSEPVPKNNRESLATRSCGQITLLLDPTMRRRAALSMNTGTSTSCKETDRTGMLWQRLS